MTHSPLPPPEGADAPSASPPGGGESGRQSFANDPLLPLGALISLSYLAALFIEAPVPVAAGWKAAGIVLFAAYAFIRGAPIVGAALIASAAGDVALALRPPVFVAGMAFFGLAHLLYMAAFFLRIRRGGLDRRFLWAGALIALASTAMAVWFLPDMGALLAPGLAYQAIITVMVAVALVSCAPLLGRLGAVVFMASDTLIALGLYKHIAVPPGAVWIAYAAAQFMLANGLAAREPAMARRR